MTDPRAAEETIVDVIRVWWVASLATLATHMPEPGEHVDGRAVTAGIAVCEEARSRLRLIYAEHPEGSPVRAACAEAAGALEERRDAFRRLLR